MKQDLQHLICVECEKHSYCTGCEYYKLSTCNVSKMTEHELKIAESMSYRGVNNEKNKIWFWQFSNYWKYYDFDNVVTDNTLLI